MNTTSLDLKSCPNGHGALFDPIFGNPSVRCIVRNCVWAVSAPTKEEAIRVWNALPAHRPVNQQGDGIEPVAWVVYDTRHGAEPQSMIEVVARVDHNAAIDRLRADIAELKNGSPISALREAAEKYYATYIDNYHEERYLSQRQFAEWEVDNFLDWLEKQSAEQTK